jgi:hypothetical protein
MFASLVVEHIERLDAVQLELLDPPQGGEYPFYCGVAS